MQFPDIWLIIKLISPLGQCTLNVDVGVITIANTVQMYGDKLRCVCVNWEDIGGLRLIFAFRLRNAHISDDRSACIFATVQFHRTNGQQRNAYRSESSRTARSAISDSTSRESWNMQKRSPPQFTHDGNFSSRIKNDSHRRRAERPTLYIYIIVRTCVSGYRLDYQVFSSSFPVNKR